MFGVLSENERNLNRNRILLLLGPAIYPAWWGIFRFASPQAIDPVIGRLGIALFLFAIFGLTFMSVWAVRHLNRLILVCGSVVTIHYFYLLQMNHTDTNYLLASFVTVFAVSSCYITRRQSLAYSVLVVILAAVICAMNPGMPRLVFASGILTGIVVSYVAVSSRLRVLESLLESEERFRTMADTAPVMIWMSDEHGACNFLNSVWIKFTGVSSNQAAGNGWTKCIHPEDLNGYLEKYFSAFRARRSFQGEYRLKRADGEFRWVFAESIPIYQPSGRFEGYIGTCVDITTSKNSSAVPV